MRLLAVWVWLIFSLFTNCSNELLMIQLPEAFLDQSSKQVGLSCSEVFHFTDPRNCCSIPYLLPSDVLQPCLQQIPLTSNPWEGENCRAECILNQTNIIMDGQFQIETAKALLTEATTEDTVLTSYIQYASVRCYRMFAHEMYANPFDACSPAARHMLDCIFAITYRKCPDQYWTATNECRLLVRSLNECPYFLVHSDSF